MGNAGETDRNYEELSDPLAAHKRHCVGQRVSDMSNGMYPRLALPYMTILIHYRDGCVDDKSLMLGWNEQ